MNPRSGKADRGFAAPKDGKNPFISKGFAGIGVAEC